MAAWLYLHPYGARNHTYTSENASSLCRQCSSGLQAVADVAAAIRAGYYTIGMAAGVESMTMNPMDWKAEISPRVAEHKSAANCMLPMGALLCLQRSEGIYCFQD